MLFGLVGWLVGWMRLDVFVLVQHGSVIVNGCCRCCGLDINKCLTPFYLYAFWSYNNNAVMYEHAYIDAHVCVSVCVVCSPWIRISYVRYKHTCTTRNAEYSLVR